MRKALVALALAVSAGSAYAAPAAEQLGLKQGELPQLVVPAPAQGVDISEGALKGLTGVTALEKIKSLFELGVPATKEDLTGWYSGRTVYTNKEVVKGALLVGWEAALNSDGGPLLEDKVLKVIFNESDTPSSYDELSDSYILGTKTLMEETSKFYAMEFPGARAVLNESGYRSVVEERKAGEYIVEHWTSYTPAGSIYQESYSYYFKNVTPR